MNKFLKVIIIAAAVMTANTVPFISAESAKKAAGPLSNNDLKLIYGVKKTLALFETDYNNFTKLAGNTGVWEDENKYQYTWEDGQAAFIKTAEMKKPELVQIVLNENFKTPRGIKKDSSLNELLHAYPEYTETTEGGNGLWYTYRWSAKSKSPLINGQNFSISFFVEENKVKTVLLKLESTETEEIPVG